MGLGFRVWVLVLLFQERLLLRIYVLDPSSQGLGFSVLGDNKRSVDSSSWHKQNG